MPVTSIAPLPAEHVIVPLLIFNIPAFTIVLLDVLLTVNPLKFKLIFLISVSVDSTITFSVVFFNNLIVVSVFVVGTSFTAACNVS